MTAMDKWEIVSSFPEHVRIQVVQILKTDIVNKEWLNNDDILCYLAVASMSSKLKNACEEKLLDNLSIVNCLDALEIAKTYELLRLKKETIRMIAENLKDLCYSDSFQILHENSLEYMCNMEGIAKHSDIFVALDIWLQYNHEARLKDYCKMLEIVQQQRSPHKCVDRKRRYTTYHAMLMSSAAKSKNTVITAVFNCDGDLVCHRKLFKSTDIKDGFSVACVQKDESDAPYVFISSGKRVFRYDPMLNKEETCASLNHTRIDSSLVAFGDCVYAIGGHHNGSDIHEIEEYDTRQHNTKILKKKWKDVSRIPDKIKLHCAPCVVHDNTIYIIGEKNEGQASTVVISFKPEGKLIQIAAEFPQQLSNCKAVLHKSDIYICSSDGIFLKFDTNTNIFTSCCDFPIKCRHFGMYTEGDMIYTVCGASSNNIVDQFEKDEYDIDTNSWKRKRNVSCNLPIFGNCDIKVPSYTNVIPFYDTPFKEIRR
jgi:hypothetical protein